MILFYGGLLFILLLFVLLTSRYGDERIRGLDKKYHSLKIFYSSGAFLADRLDSLLQMMGRQGVSVKKQQKLRELTVAEDISDVKYRHEAKRFSIVILCLLMLGGLGIITELQIIAEDSPALAKRLARGSYGEGERSYEVSVEGLKDSPTTVVIDVGEQKYSDKEAEEVFRKVYLELRETVLGENISVSEVCKPLNFVTGTSYASVSVSWEPEDVDLIDSFGTLGQAIPPDGELTYVTAHLTDGVHKTDYQFNFRVFPSSEPNLTADLLRFKETLAKLDKEQQESEVLLLPDTFEEKQLQYHKVKEENNNSILLLGLVTAVVLFFAADYQLDEQVKQRDRQMLLDYSEIVSKLTILMGAGLTVKSAWERIIKDYEGMLKNGRKGKRYAYEEMELAFYCMKNGTFEGQAYGAFGRRCRLHPYIKLGGLLEQNIKTGTKNLKGLLELESSDAFLERKVLARRLGEEAGTKLLLPMFLMLAVVMIVIVVPAFLSFS